CDQTVWRWRKALGVPEHNPGTLRLRRAYAAQLLLTPTAKRRAVLSRKKNKVEVERANSARARSRDRLRHPILSSRAEADLNAVRYRFDASGVLVEIQQSKT